MIVLNFTLQKYHDYKSEIFHYFIKIGIKFLFLIFIGKIFDLISYFCEKYFYEENTLS